MVQHCFIGDFKILLTILYSVQYLLFKKTIHEIIFKIQKEL